MTWPCPPALHPVDEGFHLAHTPREALRSPSSVPKLLAPFCHPLSWIRPNKRGGVCPLGTRDLVSLASHRKSE